MKCLLVADIHYDLRKFDWVLEASELVDLVVIAGDHLEIASMVERPAQAVVAQKYFRRIRERAPLLISSGNHDLDGRYESGEPTAKWIRAARYYKVPTDGDTHEFDDTLFSLCPWWEGETGKQEVAELLARDAKREARRWVWVYHGPPTDSPTSWGGSRSYGDPDLLAWIEQYRPALVLSGHVHQSPFVPNGSWADRIGDTWIFNAGHQVGPVPAHVVVDLEEPRAYWLSLTGSQSAALDEPLTRPLERLQERPEWLQAMGRLTSRHLG